MHVYQCLRLTMIIRLEDGAVVIGHLKEITGGMPLTTTMNEYRYSLNC